MFKIALTQALSQEGMEYLKQFATFELLNLREPEKILPKLDGVDALISRGGDVPEWFLLQAAAKGVRVIGKTAAGLDGVDLSGATKAGIPIVYAPGANARSVAEHAVTAMLALNKNLMGCNYMVRNGEYQKRFGYHIIEFCQKRVFIVGFGAVGREVAQMCRGLSMSVSVFDKYVPRENVERLGYSYFDKLLDGLAQADFVTLHMPLTPETKNLIGDQELGRMKPSAYLINTARGGIVDEQALLEALESGKLAGAAVDAIASEPNVTDSPLMKTDRALLSPHVAGQTDEAMFRQAKDCVDGIIAVLQGKQWPKVGNQDVYNRPEWQGKV